MCSFSHSYALVCTRRRDARLRLYALVCLLSEPFSATVEIVSFHMGVRLSRLKLVRSLPRHRVLVPDLII
jgi:hypothetical protein